MGAVGGAEVLSVSSAPPIQSGKGNVVSGKFIHEATNCIDLHIEGHDNPIGCTDNHPFWSEDRQEFIPAGELNQGERVLLYSGETARIAQKLPRPGPETVYNLEIWGEHVYHVGNDGVLVHNSCAVADINKTPIYRAGKTFKIRDKDITLNEEGLVDPKRGVSVNSDIEALSILRGSKFRIIEIPDELQIVHTSGTHYEIVPKVAMTRGNYQLLLDQIKIVPVK